MTPLIEVCTHCWHYDRLLCYHLSAFTLFPPKECCVRVTVCYCEEDEPTVAVLDFFGRKSPPNVEWNWRPMQKERLLRRGIGRNEVALTTEADYLMFSDADYLLGEGMIDAFVLQVRARQHEKLWYPRIIRASDHEHGDAAIESVSSPQEIWIEPKRYRRLKLYRAIGGAQYIPRRIANEFGYCKRSRRYQKPSSFWRRTFEDTRYRKTIGVSRGVGLPFPSVFRIRHSRRGRDHPEIRL